MQSKELTQFYNDYLSWVNDGTPAHKIFNVQHGLCTNATEYGSNLYKNSLKITKELYYQFKNEGLSTRYPFNEGINDFTNEYENGSYHLNEKRMNWVKKYSNLESEK